MNPVIPSFEFRRRARAAMKPLMSVLVVAALIAMLPGLLASTVISVTNSSPASALDAVVVKMENFIIDDVGGTEGLQALMEQLAANPQEGDAEAARALEEAIAKAMNITEHSDELLAEFKSSVLDYVHSPKAVLFVGLHVLDFILSPVLILGFFRVLLLALRKEPFSPATVLCRMRYVLRALGLRLMIGLRLVLIMLPGLAVMLLGALIPTRLSSVIITIGSAAMIIMALIASYRYCLSEFFMADKPMGVNAAIRESCRVMRNRKMEMFSLQVSFLGWLLLEMLLEGYVYSLFGNVIGMALGMLMMLVLQLYMYMANAAFYQEYACKAAEPADSGDFPDLA